MDNSFIHFKIDSELKKEFQIIALKQNKTITALLTEFIQDTVNENTLSGHVLVRHGGNSGPGRAARSPGTLSCPPPSARGEAGRTPGLCTPESRVVTGTAMDRELAPEREGGRMLRATGTQV